MYNKSHVTIGLVLALLVSFSFTGCKKDDDNVDPAVRNQIIGVWNADSYQFVTTVNGTTTTQTDVLSGTFDFRSDNKVIYTDNSGNSTEGTWELTDGNKKIKVVFSGGFPGIDTFGYPTPDTFEIKEITANTFVLYYIYAISGGGQSAQYEFTVNLKK